MKKYRIFILAAALLGVSAFATAEALGAIDVLAEFKPVALVKGLYIGKVKGSKKVQADVRNKLTATYATSISYDFPACAAYGAGTTTACHGHSVGFTLTGAKIGDTCLVSSDKTIGDGGIIDDITFDCQVVDTDVAVVRYHVTDSDAGVTDLPDAGFTIRIFSNQVQ